MTASADRAARYVEAILSGRRPPRFRASQGDADVLSAAAALSAARPGAAVPDRRFLERLHGRLAHELDGEARPAPSRRDLLRTGAGAAAAAVLGGAGGLALGLGARPGPPPARLEVDGAHWLDAVDAESVSPGTAVAFTTSALQLLIVNVDGRLRAFSGTCTHLGCRLQPAAAAIACPCHRTTFGLDGRVLTHQLPVPPASLPELPVRVVAGRVQVFAI